MSCCVTMLARGVFGLPISRLVMATCDLHCGSSRACGKQCKFALATQHHDQQYFSEKYLRSMGATIQLLMRTEDSNGWIQVWQLHQHLDVC